MKWISVEVGIIEAMPYRIKDKGDHAELWQRFQGDKEVRFECLSKWPTVEAAKEEAENR